MALDAFTGIATMGSRARPTASGWLRNGYQRACTMTASRAAQVAALFAQIGSTSENGNG